ncbi:hypothetical protein Hrd1104_00170 [Halorhabdus sp. CBA1104]|nr:hypothetical protein Hrd1104_00170 [Halorhabdus sp. CBA1104]
MADRFRQNLLSWFDDNSREYPWRDEDRSLYEVFVAEFFLTQTPADNVADVYPTFLDRFPTLDSLDDADPERIESTIEPLGFQRMRTEALVEIAERYESLPEERDELTSLPRVGPYVADATLCFACERPHPIVDRNVVRVYDRIFGSAFPDGQTERRAFADELLSTNGSEARRYNLALLDFGAIRCQKRDPGCTDCFAAEYCDYYRSTDSE